MKLLHKSYLQASVLLIPALLIGALFSYLIIRYIVYEETDEFLSYEMQRILQYHEQFNDLPDDHKAVKILEETIPHEAFFRDTLILEPADNEKVPHRELHFGLQHNDTYYTIVLRNLLPGKDDLIEGTLLIMAGMITLLLLIFTLMVSWLSRKTWNPFYKIISSLGNYQLGASLPEFPPSGIDEFTTLQNALINFMKNSNNDYKRTKEFNENASHEFQTHLAVIRAETEILLNSTILNREDAEHLQRIHRSTLSLSRVQNSLLLLSKIGNREFNQNSQVDLQQTIRRILVLFGERLILRNITLKTETEAAIILSDPGLIDILITNLINNAIKHNINDGYINIELKNRQLCITNSGLPIEGSPGKLMERFVKGESGNMGIGLAIVKQIVELYNFEIEYGVNEEAEHRICIRF